MRFASCMAPNAESFFIDTVRYLADRLGIDANIAHDTSWERREEGLDSGEIEVGWICGLPYVWKADQSNPTIQLLAAPVMRGTRYGDLPVYFSDVMVRTVSPIKSFSDLRGSRWAYNEPRSHSGYNVVKAHLYDLGERDGFFGTVCVAGSHENALEMILADTVDAAAIDTTVYETTLKEQPEIQHELRAVATLGPSPIPPWIISARVDPATRARIREVLTRMHQTDEGISILHRHDVARYEVVSDTYYNPIRTMDDKARQVQLGDEPC